MRRLRLAQSAAVALICCGTVGARAAPEPTYPFVGTWVRADRACTASAARERVYTPRDVISNRSRCTIKRVAHGSGGYELFERCERGNEKPVNVSEIIRMTGPDMMVLTRQTNRLKLSRSLHFARCAAAQGPAAPAAKPH